MIMDPFSFTVGVIVGFVVAVITGLVILRNGSDDDPF